ncbi:MAG: aminopeptidase P family protein [Paracoccaceae bacterium]
MFQTFEVSSRPEDGPPRLAALRAEMRAEGLDGFLVPRADAHQGENVAARDERLAWLTSFTGSAGFCAVLLDRAGMFIDGRYRAQVRSDVSLDHFTPVHWPEVELAGWLRDALGAGSKIGFDAWLHTADSIEKLQKDLADSGVEILACDNLVDRIWANQPLPPKGKITAYLVEYAGQSSADKRESLATDLRTAQQVAAIITLPDSIAWLLNIRGSDIARVPVPHGFLILRDDAKACLFVDPEKCAGLAPHLGPEITLADPDAFLPALAALSGPVRVDKASAPLKISEVLNAAGVEIAWGQDPCILPKARKNETEIAGTQAAHLRDAGAMVEFLAWLGEAAPKGDLSEIDVVRRLEGFRRATDALLDISFDTICGAGPNGAIVHYRVNEASNRAIAPGELLLIDSGGQYIDGTTDITRTVAVGEVGDDERAAFTRVLQGMIAISRARWPKGLCGRDLDSLARQSLWLAGQDYDHGTGHGVGTYLSVHEGPQGISRRAKVALEPGMILSNEPGYYRIGAFGIRTENLMVVREAPPLAGADVREMLSFETLTFVPIDRRLIIVDMLTADQLAWINAYHAEVLEKIAARVGQKARRWLALAAAPM